MKPSPSTSRSFEDFSSLPKKRKLMHLSESEKNMIINVYKFVKETWPVDKYQSKTEMKEKTAIILGIARTTVYRILKEYTQNDEVKPPALPKKPPNLIETVNDSDKSAIRNIVHRFNSKREFPTLDKILQAVNADDTLPNFSRTSLWRVLKNLEETESAKN